MELQLRFQSQTHSIRVPSDVPLSHLMQEICSQLSILPENQKIIYRGKPLDIPSMNLSEFSVSNGSKLLLYSSQNLQHNTASQNSKHFNSRYRSQALNDSMEHEPHISVIKKGKPPKCIISTSGQTNALPPEGFIVYNKLGIVCKLFLETDALFVEGEDGTTDRIFFSDVSNYGVISLPKPNNTYFSYGVQTSRGMSWFYFIPNQYKEYFQRLLSSL
jgi:hypothetical protein